MVYVGERYNRYGTHILVEDDGVIRSVPREWTDLFAPDPEVILGGGYLLVRDLTELTRLVEDLTERRTLESRDNV